VSEVRAPLVGTELGLAGTPANRRGSELGLSTPVVE